MYKMLWSGSCLGGIIDVTIKVFDHWLQHIQSRSLTISLEHTQTGIKAKIFNEFITNLIDHKKQNAMADCLGYLREIERLQRE